MTPLVGLNSAAANALRTKLINFDGNGKSLWRYTSGAELPTVYAEASTIDPTLTHDKIHWMLFRGLYNAAKQQVLEDLKADAGCIYFNDVNAIFKAPHLLTTTTEINEFIGNQVDFLTETDCQDVCARNVEIWLTTFRENCDLDPTSAVYANLEAAFEAYCLSGKGCGTANPLRIYFPK